LAEVSRPDLAGDSTSVIRDIRASAIADGEVQEIEIEQIDLNPYQTRKEFDEQQLKDLAASIEAQGVMQPIVVRPAPSRPMPEGPLSSTSNAAEPSPAGTTAQASVAAASHALANPASANVVGATPAGPTNAHPARERFILILGERRLRASKMLGRKMIPAVVRRVSDQTAAEMTLVENLQRADLDCVEQANAFRNLSQTFRMTQEAIAKRVGISREQVSNYMRLLHLPADVFLALQKKELTYSHARLLLMLHSDEHRSKLAQAAVKQKMSVGRLEELVMGTITTDPKEKRPGMARWLDPNVRAAQRSIEEAIGMRVRISDRRGKGKITIEYASLEDFDRIVGKLKN
jgi:ParB family transcriptional regulator, chromosome partitioning protein